MSSAPPNPLPVVLPWVIAGIALFVIASIAGVGTAYLLTTANAVPTVDPARLPSPTVRPTAPPSGRASATPGSSVTAAPTASVTPTSTAVPTDTPAPSPTETAAGPSPTPISYIVKRGDRLGDIAAQFGVTVDAIVELNKLKNPDHIEVGQVLLIPVP